MNPPVNTSRHCFGNAHYCIANWLTIIICFIGLSTEAQIIPFSADQPSKTQQDKYIQQPNLSGDNKAILTTDFDQPYCSPIFMGIPADQVLPCGSEMPSWPVVVAKLQDRELEVIPSERIEFHPCGGKVVTRLWSITDAEGKRISRQQIITFFDADPPVMSIAGDAVVGSIHEIPPPYYQATDYGCSSFTIDISEEEVSLAESGYSIIRRYEATDGCGNTTTRTQQIHVTKSEGPEKQAKRKSVSALEFHK
jgi:hypothetical protein